MSYENENLNDGYVQKKRRVKAIDIVAYVICLLIAFGIWTYVLYTENSDYEYKFTGVIVELDGAATLKENHNLTPINGYGTEVTITVRGPRSEIMKYDSEDIFAYVDLSSVSQANRYSLEVNVDLPQNIQLVSSEPAKINVFVDETVTKQIPVVIEPLFTAADNVTVFDPVIDDEDILNGMITIEGPSSVVKDVDHALVVKDLGVITTGVKFNSQFTLIDTFGEEITNPYVKTDVTEISVSVKVELEKIVALEAKVKDEDPAYKYNVEWSYDGSKVENIRIKGDPLIIAGYEKMSLEVSGERGNMAFPEDIEIYIGDVRVRSISYSVTKTLIEPDKPTE